MNLIFTLLLLVFFKVEDKNDENCMNRPNYFP
jgi:hypothetical protein